MSTSDATKIRTSTYYQTQKTFTHRHQGEKEKEKEEESEEGGVRGIGGGGGFHPICVLFWNSFTLLVWSPPGPVKSPHKFIKDENLFSI